MSTFTTVEQFNNHTYRVEQSTIPTFAVDQLDVEGGATYFSQDEQAAHDVDRYDAQGWMYIAFLLGED